MPDTSFVLSCHLLLGRAALYVAATCAVDEAHRVRLLCLGMQCSGSQRPTRLIMPRPVCALPKKLAHRQGC